MNYQQQMNQYYQPNMQYQGLTMMNPGMQPQQPTFNMLTLGKGINQQELDAIKNSAIESYLQNMCAQGATRPAISAPIGNSIKSKIGGEWFVFISELGDKEANFSMTAVAGSDYMVFSLNNKTQFQVLRIK